MSRYCFAMLIKSLPSSVVGAMIHRYLTVSEWACMKSSLAVPCASFCLTWGDWLKSAPGSFRLGAISAANQNNGAVAHNLHRVLGEQL